MAVFRHASRGVTARNFWLCDLNCLLGLAGAVTDDEADGAEAEDGSGATGVVAWPGGTLTGVWDGCIIADIVGVATTFDVWAAFAEADTKAFATVVVLWPETVKAATVLSFIIISYK